MKKLRLSPLDQTRVFLMESGFLGGGRSRAVARAGWSVGPGMTFPLEETELILCQPVWLRGAVGGQLPLTPEAMWGSWGTLLFAIQRAFYTEGTLSLYV